MSIRILHLAGNFPDGISPGPKTTAVKHLLDYADDFEHVVVSLTRVLRPWQERLVWRGNTLVVQYFALPRALLHHTFMARVARRIDAALAERGEHYDLVHAHKLSMEGFVANKMKTVEGLPRIYSIRPYTDLRVFALGESLRDTGRDLLQRAAGVMLLAPWARTAVTRQLGQDINAPTLTVPNAVINAVAPADIADQATRRRFVTVFRAGQYKAKGFDLVVQALASLEGDHAEVGIDVYGSGDWRGVKSFVERAGVGDRVRFMGRLDNAALLQRFSEYLGLAMPSQRETFGMVFAEALCSGIPVIYAKQASIDGFFEADSIGAAVAAGDVPALAEAMRRIDSANAEFRASIRGLRESGELDIFLPHSIRARYRSLIDDALQQ